MLIVCPFCASEYALDSDRIGPAGRRVRCAACRESWLVASPSVDEDGPGDLPDVLAGADLRTSFDEAAPTDPAPAERTLVVIDAPSPAAPTSPEPEPTRLRRGLGRGGRRGRGALGRPRTTARRLAVAALLLVALAVPAAWAWRTGIVRLVPQSAVLFAAVGLPVNLVGLDFASVTSTIGEANDKAGGKPELIVEGQITNPGSRALPVPPVEIAIRGGDGALLYHWSVVAQDARLAGGATTRFRGRLLSPPPAGRSVAVTFRAGTQGAVVALQ